MKQTPETNSHKDKKVELAGLDPRQMELLETTIRIGLREAGVMLAMPDEYFGIFQKIGPDIADAYGMEPLGFDNIEALRFHYRAREKSLKRIAIKLDAGDMFTWIELEQLLKGICTAIQEGLMYATVSGRSILRGIAFLNGLYQKWGCEPWTEYSQIPLEELPDHFEKRTEALKELRDDLKARLVA